MMSVEIMWALVDLPLVQGRALWGSLQHPPPAPKKGYWKVAVNRDGKGFLYITTREMAEAYLKDPSGLYRAWKDFEGRIIIATEEEWERWHSD